MKLFEVKLKNDRTRPYQVLASLILLVNILFFIMAAVYNRGSLATGSAVVVGGISLIWYLAARHSQPGLMQHWKTITLALILVGHLVLGFWWAALALLALALLYRLAMRPLVVRITAERIEYPSLPTRMIAWGELNNIILKDGWLTIDFRNNRVAQVQVADEWYDDNRNNEKDLNEFCYIQLTTLASGLSQ